MDFMTEAIALPDLMSKHGYTYADFTEGERTSISDQIGKLVAAGYGSDQALARAVKHCAPSRTPVGTPAKVGGQYVWSRNGDGTYNIFDVPVFVKHTRKLGMRMVADKDGEPKVVEETIDIDEKWLNRACEVNQRRYFSDSYLGPLHVRHHKQDPNAQDQTEAAGHFLLKYVNEVSYDGETVPVLFADFLRIPAAVFERIKAGQLPYRSIESLPPKYEEIDSIALLDTDTPWFRLPLLALGAEIQREVYAVTSGSSLVRGYATAGKAWAALCYEHSASFSERKDEDDEPDKDEAGDKGEAGDKDKMNAGAGSESDESDVDGLSDDMTDENVEATLGGDTMSKILEALQSLAKTNELILARLGGAVQPPTPQVPGAPVVETAGDKTKTASYDGRLAAVESILAAQRTEVDLRGKVKALLVDLGKRFNLGSDAEERLFAKARESKDPDAVIAAYKATIEEHGTQVPTPWIPGVPASILPASGTGLPDEVKEYQAKGPEVLAKAIKANAAYDEAKKVGLVSGGVTRKDFIKYNIDRDFSALVTG